ncbi:MAG TPA: hypothetical protein VGG48_05880 [Rhizomicrobium sp.]
MLLLSLPAEAGLFSSSSSSSSPSQACGGAKGDVIVSARTDEVDLFSDPDGTKKAMTIEQGKFPTCVPILARSPRILFQVTVNGANYWVRPYMVKYVLGGKQPAVCRNLALGSNQIKAAATRGLGEGCHKG